MIKFRAVAAILLLAGLCAPAYTHAQSITVISNPATSVSADDVRDVFLGEKQIAGGVKLTPVDNASAQAIFLNKLIKLDVAKYSAVWTKKAFREGLSAPAAKATDADVIEFVKRTPGGLGYIKSSAPSGVKVVTQLP